MRPLAVLVLVTWPTAVVQAARALARQPELLAAVAVRPAQPEPLVLHLLPVGCLGKVAAVAAVVLLALAVPGVLAVVALVVAVVVLHAVHTQPVLAA